ncbi:MAG: hypothetical protein OP8BY_1031 [Candidatus Saccharicenans subterraneus]|uniref:Uncharacterized protein n=1 Tax=Candidatus Saccharicenans subterraneus TaxID=2508984 RepID=A0A3E2BQT8_9BACT|nr:MAG: hypothetical protein OP8BY_1031 [Candidatus Saccharicenans subterraneum]
MFTVCLNLKNIIWSTSNFRAYRIYQSRPILNTPFGENGIKLFHGNAKIISWFKIKIDKISFMRS